MSEQIPVITVAHLTKRYKDIVAVNDVSFSVQPGEILGILGPNGSGKTTTLKSILGIVHYDSGHIAIDGMEHRMHREYLMRHAGAVLEGNRNVYWYLSPRENLEYFAGIKGLSTASIKDRMEMLLEMLELTDVSQKTVREFSRGMQQKVAIACAFIHDPKILFLDEPTLGLDVETTRAIKILLKKIVAEEQKTIIVTSHDMRFIEDVCDRVLIINKGRIISHETVSSLKNKYALRTLKIVTEATLSDAQRQSLLLLDSCNIEEFETGHRVIVGLKKTNLIYELMNILAREHTEIRSIDIEEDNLEDIFVNLIHNGEQ